MENPAGKFWSRTLFWGIVAVAAVVRLCCLGSIPFMHDEFSALFRTGYNSFGQLITKGVTPDAHPAGAQLILAATTALAGWDEFWVKLPFALMGLGSVVLVYGISRKVFNKTSALFVASYVAATQFFVFYSQIARPYSSGLFFLLLATLAAVELVRSDKKQAFWVAPIFVIALVASSMMHYFAMLMAGFLFLGFAWIAGRQNWKRTAMMGLAAVVLYAPNFPVMWSQLSAGGIGDWLGRPTSRYLPEFLAYSVHFSWALALVLATFFFLGLRTKHAEKPTDKQWMIVFIASFVLSFAIGMAYSFLRTPVIQYSTLFFSFPFFVMGLAGLMRPMKPTFNVLMTVLILGVSLFTLTLERKHFWMMQHQGYEQIASRFAQNRKTLADSVSLAAVGGSERMLDFYQQRFGVDSVRLFNKDHAMADFENWVDHCSTPWFAVGWTDYASFQWVEYVRSRFPRQVEHENWFNSGYYLFRRDTLASELNQKAEKTYLLERNSRGIKNFSEDDEFGLLWEIPTDSALTPFNGIWVAGVELIAHSTMRNASIVMEVKKDSLPQPLLWRSCDLSGRQLMPGDTSRIVIAYHLDSGPAMKPGSVLRLYVWNSGHEKFTVTKRWFYTRKYEPVLFGLYKHL